MRRFRVGGLAAAALALTLVAPVAADTIGGPNGDRLVAGASFEFVDESGRTYSASADVIDDHLAGTIRISASYYTSTTVTCPGPDPLDPGDDYEGATETSFYADAPATTSGFGSKLSSASATGTVSGDVTEYNQCTDSQTVIGQDTIQVEINLVANGATQSIVSHQVGTDDLGNRFVLIYRASERPAGGTVSFDGDQHVVDGVIMSQIWRTPVGG